MTDVQESLAIARAGQYREAADTLCAIAGMVKDADARNQMLRLADEYDVLAQYCENLLQRPLP